MKSSDIREPKKNKIELKNLVKFKFIFISFSVIVSKVNHKMWNSKLFLCLELFSKQREYLKKKISGSSNRENILKSYSTSSLSPNSITNYTISSVYIKGQFLKIWRYLRFWETNTLISNEKWKISKTHQRQQIKLLLVINK